MAEPAPQRRSHRSTAGVHSNPGGVPLSANIADRLKQLALENDESDEDELIEMAVDAAEGNADVQLDMDVLEAGEREGDPGDEYSSVVHYAEDDDSGDEGVADDDDDDDDDDGDGDGDGDGGGNGPHSPSRSPPRQRRRVTGGGTSVRGRLGAIFE